MSVINSPYASDYLDFGYGSEIDPDNVLFWRLEPEESVDEFYKYVELGRNKCSSFEYQILFKRELLERSLQNKKGDDKGAIMIEYKKPEQIWNFIHPDAP